MKSRINTVIYSQKGIFGGRQRKVQNEIISNSYHLQPKVENVIFIGPTPEFVFAYSIFTYFFPNDRSDFAFIHIDSYKYGNKSARHNYRFYNANHLFCQEKECKIASKDRWNFFDSEHLTYYGAKKVIENLTSLDQ